MKKEYKGMLYVTDYRILGHRFAIHKINNADNIILGRLSITGKLMFDVIKGTPQFKKHAKKYIKNLCKLFNLECNFMGLKARLKEL